MSNIWTYAIIVVILIPFYFGMKKIIAMFSKKDDCSNRSCGSNSCGCSDHRSKHE